MGGCNMFYKESITLSNRPSFWERIVKMFEIIGYARAAAELNKLGYHKEAKKCILEVRRLKE